MQTPIGNRQSAIGNRKGIYQALNASGDVVGDERWRVASTLGGGMRVDTDTTRIAPFPEPRVESFGLELGPDLAYRRLNIHALNGRRECVADFLPGKAPICWRLDETSRTRDYDWSGDCEIGYNSALFTSVMLWRHPLAPGQSVELRVAQLDNVAFEPSWTRLVMTYEVDERHETRFGTADLARYRLEVDGGNRLEYCWCDRAGIVFDYLSSAGGNANGGYRLMAVNFPS